MGSSSVKQSWLLLAAALLTGCSGAGAVFPHAAAQSGLRGSADSATAMPGDSATAMPGDAATAMPGDAATAMPGANFACTPATTPGAASCTLAVNINVPPAGNPNLAAELIAGLHPDALAGM